MAKVEAVSMADAGSTKKEKTLSADIKKKLDELGIDSSKVKTDAEAKKLINNAMKKKTEEVKNEQSPYVSSDTENLIMRDARALAKKLDMRVRPDLSLDDLLTRILKRIKSQKAECSDDKMKELQLQKSSVVYITLKTRQNTLLLKESGLVNSMDLNSLSNKELLKL